MIEATVLSIQLHHTPDQPLRPVVQARGLVEQGLEGDSHSLRQQGHKRQVLLLDRSTLDRFALAPGELREQITISGAPEISVLPGGTRLRAGDITLEAVGDCAPCLHIGELLGVEDPEAFRQALEKRRGLLCRVVEVANEGAVRIGDPVVQLA
ncbi:MAG: hypothetical protein J5I90_11660 [Caldilineales bacterium]|nr:hypothetical protein [Caldilineales bacterium]